MDKKEAIELLKRDLTEMPHLRELHHDNQKFKLWRDKVLDTIKATLDSGDYQKFSMAMGGVRVSGWFADDVYQKDYLENLENYETALKSIIQKYERLGIEEKSVKKTEQKDTAKSPIQLFDSMKFHPKVVEASRGLFKDKYYSQAIFEAFKAVNNFVKEKSGLLPNEIRGMKDSQLMAKVFDVNNPIIKVNELLSDTDISEQEGFKFLFMGATVGIRNPKAHDFIEMKDPHKTLEYLAFASLLLKKISFWKVN